MSKISNHPYQELKLTADRAEERLRSEIPINGPGPFVRVLFGLGSEKEMKDSYDILRNYSLSWELFVSLLMHIDEETSEQLRKDLTTMI